MALRNVRRVNLRVISYSLNNPAKRLLDKRKRLPNGRLKRAWETLALRNVRRVNLRVTSYSLNSPAKRILDKRKRRPNGRLKRG